MQMTNSFERFKQETANKLEYFPSILQSLNELSKDVKLLEEKREECVKTVTAHMARANGLVPKVEEHEKRIVDIEKLPGNSAIDKANKWKSVLIKIIVGLIIAAASVGGTILLT